MNFIKKSFPVIIILLVAFVMTFIINAADFDLWARLAVGSIFFQTGQVFKKDIFSYAQVKDQWIDHEWGAGAVFYLLTNYFGDMGLYLLKFVLITVILLIIFKIIKYKNNNCNFDPLLIILFGFASFPFLIATVRSQLFTYMFFTLWIYILERLRSGERRLIWIFPTTMLLWLNLHGGFLSGFGLLSIYLVGDLISKKNVKPYLIILALCLPITLINPYGFSFLHYVLQSALMERPNIFEWQNFNIFGPIITIYGLKVHLFLGFEIILLLSFFSLVHSFKKRGLPEIYKIILLFVTLLLGLKHQRHLMFFIIVSYTLFYPLYLSYLNHIHQILSYKFGNHFVFYIKKVKFVFIVLLFVSILPSRFLYSGKIFAVPYLYPVGAVQFIHQNNFKGKVFVPYRWGSYFLWKLYPQCLVSVDGRYEEVYPDHVFDMAADFAGYIDQDWKLYKDITKPAKNWQNFIKKYPPDIIVIPKTQTTLQKISELKDWKIVYEDNLSFVLLPAKIKAKELFILPDYSNQLYWHENLSKHVNIK